MKILICGGAGYIGSHLSRAILNHTAHSVVIIDNLSAANKAKAKHSHSLHLQQRPPSVDSRAQFELGDVRDSKFLDGVFARHRPDAVVHMCASIVVPESVAQPLRYYDNNVVGSLRLLEAMTRNGCKYIVFSSTAALFGTPKGRRAGKPIDPADPTIPESPYGETKLVMEWMLRAAGAAHGIRFVSLRYFNACGAHPDGDIGETHVPETHLIPIILQVALGQRQKIKVFGEDYPTPDGTCVRDYIHVDDLADAHIRALEYLAKGGASNYFNLGVGRGYSVKEVVAAAQRVTGKSIPMVVGPRRLGDPPMLVASAEKATKVLGWKPRHSLDEIIASAWKFHQKAHAKLVAKL